MDTEEVRVSSSPSASPDVHPLAKLNVVGTKEQRAELALKVGKYSFVFADDDDDLD